MGVTDLDGARLVVGTTDGARLNVGACDTDGISLGDKVGNAIVDSDGAWLGRRDGAIGEVLGDMLGDILGDILGL